jgi:hypothetical protein
MRLGAVYAWIANVRIAELEMYYSSQLGQSRLRAATYGRGLWEVSCSEPHPEGGLAVTFAPAC